MPGCWITVSDWCLLSCNHQPTCWYFGAENNASWMKFIVDFWNSSSYPGSHRIDRRFTKTANLVAILPTEIYTRPGLRLGSWWSLGLCLTDLFLGSLKNGLHGFTCSCFLGFSNVRFWWPRPSRSHSYHTFWCLECIFWFPAISSLTGSIVSFNFYSNQVLPFARANAFQPLSTNTLDNLFLLFPVYP